MSRAVHKAAPGREDEWHCLTCHRGIHLVAGCHGPLWVHLEWGTVAGPGAPARSDGMPPVETRMIPQQGVTVDGVWVPLPLLEELNEQGQWDSQFGDAFIGLNRDQERVLTARGLAVKETRGGCHRGPALKAFTDALYAQLTEGKQ